MYLYESLSHGEVCLLWAGWILRRWVLLKSWKWVKAAAMKRDVAFWPGHSDLRLMLLQAQIGKGWVKWKRLQSKDMFYERTVLEPKRFQQLKRHVTQQLDYILFCVMNSQDLLSNSVIRPSHSYQTTCVGTNTLPSPWGVCGHECRSGAKSLQGEESFGEMMEKEITKQQQQQSTINSNQQHSARTTINKKKKTLRRPDSWLSETHELFLIGTWQRYSIDCWMWAFHSGQIRSLGMTNGEVATSWPCFWWLWWLF